MHTIFKYHVPLTSAPTRISLPSGAKIRQVGAQAGAVFFWAEIRTDNPLEDRRFCVLATGQGIEPGEAYVGTAFAPPFVWHLFEHHP